MDKLLKALQEEKQDLVGRYACDLFIDRDGYNNAQINEFEKFAPCKIEKRTVNIGGAELLAGLIHYNNKVYIFG